MTGTRPVLPGLTGARAVAAWFVVLYHLRTGLGGQLPPLAMAVLGKGYLAVDFFFMLSGFVLWRNYGAALRAGGAAAVPGFLWRRIARIWPLHAFMLCGAVALAAVLDATGRDARHFPWDTLPANILLVQNWGFTRYLNWNDPSWSISCEWAAYLLLPLLAARTDWRAWSTARLVLLIGLIAGALHLLFVSRGAAGLGADVPRLGLPRALAGFAIGTILSVLHDRNVARHVGVPATALAAMLALAAGGPETIGIPLLLAPALLMLAAVATAPANPLASAPAVYLGEISYATYLVHFLGFIGFKLLFVTDPDAIPPHLVMLFLAGTLAASILLHHLVERPAQRALRRWQPVVRRRRPPSRSSGSAPG